MARATCGVCWCSLTKLLYSKGNLRSGQKQSAHYCVYRTSIAHAVHRSILTFCHLLTPFQSMQVESQHPYSDNAVLHWRVADEGAVAYTVWFDPQVSLQCMLACLCAYVRGCGERALSYVQCIVMLRDGSNSVPGNCLSTAFQKGFQLYIEACSGPVVSSTSCAV